MTNLAGIAPIEQTKALTHIMHYPIQMNFNAQTPAQFERIKISSKTSQAMQLDVQGYSFSSPWYLSGDIKGMVNFLRSFEGAWREPRPCCVQHRAQFWQKEHTIRHFAFVLAINIRCIRAL